LPRPSATQDIVVDAFRVESLPESEQAAGMAAYVAAYRVGMLVSTRRRAVPGQRLRRHRPARRPRLDMGLCRHGRHGGDRHAGRGLAATEPAPSRNAEAATRGDSALRRVTTAAVGAFTEFLTRKDVAAVLAFVTSTSSRTRSPAP